MSGFDRRQFSNNRCVFVGNIAYDATEQQLIEVLSAVGPVVSFRLVSDKDTGKPQGFGFCEYADSATAESAIRNLNGYDFNGRSLRVDYADRDHVTKFRPGQGGPAGSSSSAPAAPAVRPPPTAQAVATGVDAISQVVNSLSKSQLLEILTEMKRFIQTNPEAAKQLLVESPQLAQTILQIQWLFGMVRPADVQSVAARGPVPPAGVPMPYGAPPPMGGPIPASVPGPGPVPVPVPGPVAPPMMAHGMPPGPMYGGPPNMPPASMQGLPPRPMAPGPPMPPMPPHPGMMPPGPPGPPLMGGPPPLMGGMPPAGPPAGPPSAVPMLTAQQQQQLDRVMKMSPAEIAQLPPAVQEQIRVLRARLEGR